MWCLGAQACLSFMFFYPACSLGFQTFAFDRVVRGSVSTHDGPAVTLHKFNARHHGQARGRAVNSDEYGEDLLIR
ncbi:hypothetical protein C8Q74DRAFT_908158 [Fomes fomentarius]|nr:hypothetical protein C8Q74DRAFT_908158 [Fomes fomentarius]